MGRQVGGGVEVVGEVGLVEMVWVVWVVGMVWLLTITYYLTSLVAGKKFRYCLIG